MYRIDNATAATTMPTPGSVGPNPNGYFTDGDPASGIAATVVDDDWLNAVQETLADPIETSGATLSKTDKTQLTTAIKTLPTGRLLNVQIFESSATYRPTTGMRIAVIQVQGTGGAGGSCAGNGNATCASAGGGCAGTYRKVFATASVIGESVPVTIGAGGTPAPAGTNQGGTGGTTSFGSLVSITGSTGGSGGASQAAGGSATAASGTGGIATVSDGVTVIEAADGQNGETGLAICSVAVGEVMYGGSGGQSKLGVGGGRVGASNNGSAGTHGGGGSGGCSGPSDANGRTGGAGGSGHIVVWEFS